MTIKELIKVLDLRCNIEIWENKALKIFEGKAFELLGCEQYFINENIKEFFIDSLNDSINILIDYE